MKWSLSVKRQHACRPRRLRVPLASISGIAIVATTVLAAWPVSAASGPEHPVARVEETRVPAGLSASDWSSIRAAYDAKRHDVFRVEGSAGGLPAYQARNPGQRWRTRFDGRGFETMPDDGGWSWGLELVGWAVDGVERAVSEPTCTATIRGRVEYEWDHHLTEWYINDARGLEHGYTVAQRPDVQFESGAAGFRELRFMLAVRGGLNPRISGDGRNVTFLNEAGAAVVNYCGLMVFDALGAEIPAWFEEVSAATGTGLRSKAISIIVDDRDACYPLTIDPIAQQAYLKALNTGADDRFGSSVAASGDTVVVGAPTEDSNATGVNGNQSDNGASSAGAAYVFVRDGTNNWIQQAYLKASNTDSFDFFGHSLAISGDTLVVGAINEASSATGVNGNQFNNDAGAAGAAYVFVRSNGAWTQQAYLKASNTDAEDSFGSSVTVSGDTVVVGAITESSGATGVNGNQADNSAAGAGAAYVFVRSNGVWSQQAYLKASNTGQGDSFGFSAAIAGDTAVIGATSEDSGALGVNGNQNDNSVASSGAVYVFSRSNGVWSQQAYIKASNTGANDLFGASVAVSGETLVVGVYSEDSGATGVNGNQADNSAPDSGAAYVFVRSSGIWSQQSYLKASNTAAGDFFGNSVAISGDTLVVGAPFEDSGSTGVNGNQNDNSASESGAAYVFVRDTSGNWSQEFYLKASNTGTIDQFGFAVAVSDDNVVVGARGEDSSATGVNGDQANNSAGNSGAAYVFTGLDTDGDGVPDSIDVCPNDAPGLPVDCDGRPIGDYDGDCDIDMADFQRFQLYFTGPNP